MSDLEALGDPDHVCGDDCLPYEPLADRELEDLEESAHIDALYNDLNLVREHAALMLLALARAGVTSVQIPARSAAVLLDLDEVEALCLLGTDQPYDPADVVNHAIRVSGEDGYIGRALIAIFRDELMDFDAGGEAGV